MFIYFKQILNEPKGFALCSKIMFSYAIIDFDDQLDSLINF